VVFASQKATDPHHTCMRLFKATRTTPRQRNQHHHLYIVVEQNSTFELDEQMKDGYIRRKKRSLHRNFNERKPIFNERKTHK
jgi:hypothetical protein